DVAAEVMTIEGQGAVHYQTMGLRSEQIAFYVARDLVVAQGEPVLSDRDSEVAGTEMTYRIDRGQGLIFQGRSELDTGHYRGERIKRADSEALFVREGEFSTCDQERTHYHFHASRMKIIPGERVVARPVVLYIGRIPILAIPFAVFPIRSGRQSGLPVPDTEFGFDSSRGRFLRNIGYYWAPSDYVDALLWVDYYEEEPSTILNLKTNYRLRYRLSGSLEASYARQGDEEQGRSDHWLFRIGHDQTLGERASLKISGQFQSDKDYAGDRDFGASVDERINQVLRSQLSFNQSWSSASLSVYADRTENLDDPGNEASVRISQAIPSVNLSLNSLPLGVKPNARGRGGRLGWLASTYLRGDLRLRSVYSKTWGGTRESNQAAGLGLTLSDNRRLLGILSLSPSASLSAAYAREDAAGRKNRTGMSWSTGLSAGTVLYGTFLPRLGAWEGLRHVVELNASYSYRPELTSLKDFPSVGGIGLSSSKASSLTLRATQRFHLKWRVGDRSGKAENVLVWGTSTSYDFLAAEKVSGDQKPRYWSDVSHSIRIDPGSFLSTDLSITHDPERWRDDYQLSLRNTLRLNGGGAAAPATSAGVEGYGGFGDPAAGIDAGPGGGTGLASLAGPWHMTLSHVLSKSAGARERSSTNLSLGLSLTPAWRLQYSLYYDLTEKDVTSQGYSLYRDLHCWQAMFERRESGGRSSYYFRVSIKELPDIKYERRRF
ncbi:MAG: putative LPS assembly protein LptD, partial [Candidatus Eisenbacteria bacterium]